MHLIWPVTQWKESKCFDYLHKWQLGKIRWNRKTYCERTPHCSLFIQHWLYVVLNFALKIWLSIYQLDTRSTSCFLLHNEVNENALPCKSDFLSAVLAFSSPMWTGERVFTGLSELGIKLETPSETISERELRTKDAQSNSRTLSNHFLCPLLSAWRWIRRDRCYFAWRWEFGKQMARIQCHEASSA